MTGMAKKNLLAPEYALHNQEEMLPMHDLSFHFVKF